MTPPPRPQPVTDGGWPLEKALARFDQFYIPEPNSGCWLWTGDISCGGYGRIMVGAVRMRAHRFAVEFIGGERVPAGHVVCHRCDNPTCVNPEHLFVGTQGDNVVDAFQKGRLPPPVAPKKLPRPFGTTCKRGHLWAEETTRLRPNGRRECRECSAQRERLRYASQGSRWHQRTEEWKSERREKRRAV
jgi:hypothetical protein